MTPGQEPIIIVKKRNGHGGHHGGAWKVAYADFVTAMMALFIVLWLLNSSQKVQKAVGGYFRDPEGHGKLVGSSLAGQGENLVLKQEDMKELKQRLEDALKQSPELKLMSKHVEITVTGEGLRIELLESQSGVFFELGNPTPTAGCQKLLAVLSQEVGRLHNTVAIEGHTDAAPYVSDKGYDNWDLSTERANAARRLMQKSGLRPGQVKQLRGFAEQLLRNPQQPLDAANRRISVIIQYDAAQTTSAPPAGEEQQKTPSAHASSHAAAPPPHAPAHPTH